MVEFSASRTNELVPFDRVNVYPLFCCHGVDDTDVGAEPNNLAQFCKLLAEYGLKYISME